MKGLLRTTEEQNGELAEQLKNANATVEQYRSVVLTLEDSLKKEKEVQLFDLFFLVIQKHTLFFSSIFCIFSHTPAHTRKLTLLHSLVPLPSGDPAEGV